MEKATGQPIDRVEGRAKVTGSARYAADYHFKNMAYGVAVTSDIAKGHILSINSKAAENLPGVLTVMSHLNAPDVPGYGHNPMSNIPIYAGKEFKPFLDNQVHFNLQPVALVIAETLEQAQYAASLVKVNYQAEEHQTDIHKNADKAVTPEKSLDHSRGQADAWKNAPVKIEQEYQTPLQVHNPMEPHATTDYWKGSDKLYIYNKSQGVKTTRRQFAKYFNLEEENVKVYSPFVGGAFGSSSRMWPQEMSAVMAAKKVNRPVQVALQRTQVFNMVGYRPCSIQKIGIGANANGTITGISHEAYGITSQYEQFTERILDPTKSM